MKIFMIAVDRVKKFLGIVSPSNSAQSKEKSMYPKGCPLFKNKYCPFEGSSEACKECIVWKENAE